MNDDGSDRPRVAAAPVLDDFYTEWEVPGVQVVAYPFASDPSTLLRNLGFAGQCTDAGVQAFDNGTFTGLMQTWTACGGTRHRATCCSPSARRTSRTPCTSRSNCRMPTTLPCRRCCPRCVSHEAGTSAALIGAAIAAVVVATPTASASTGGEPTEPDRRPPRGGLGARRFPTTSSCPPATRRSSTPPATSASPCPSTGTTSTSLPATFEGSEVPWINAATNLRVWDETFDAPGVLYAAFPFDADVRSRL